MRFQRSDSLHGDYKHIHMNCNEEFVGLDWVVFTLDFDLIN